MYKEDATDSSFESIYSSIFNSFSCPSLVCNRGLLVHPLDILGATLGFQPQVSELSLHLSRFLLRTMNMSYQRQDWGNMVLLEQEDEHLLYGL